MPSIPLDADASLRPLSAADAPAFLDAILRNRAHLDRWLRWSSGIQVLADAEAFLAGFLEKQERGDGFHLGIMVEGALAGGCVCWYIHRQNRNAEVGYWLDERHTGRGLARRAAAAVIGHLFANEGLHRVEMLCGVGNLASRAIPERLGFRLEGIRRESHWITDRFVDHAVYGILAAEWAARPPSPLAAPTGPA